MSTIVKICGLSQAQHVDAAVEAGAGLTGYVFFSRSPRNVTIENAASLTVRVPDHVRKVALTVDADDELLDQIVAGAGVDTLQLHGHETVKRVDDVRQKYGLRVIKVLPIATVEDVKAAHAFEVVSDMLLFDAKPPKDATRPGGNAISFDWGLLSDESWSVPWLLAGGLDPENVGAAIKATNAPMVDVSSGVEDTPGQKSTQKIQDFIAAVKQV